MRRRAPCSALVLLPSVVACASAGADELATARRGVAQSFSLAALSLEESAALRDTDWAHPPDARACLGPDPTAIAALPTGGFVALLARDHAAVTLDADLNERARIELDGEPRALALGADGTVFVGFGDRPGVVALSTRLGQIARTPSLDAPALGRFGVRGLAAVRGCLFAADEAANELSVSCGGATTVLAVPTGPTAVVSDGAHLVVTSPIAHRARLFALEDPLRPRELATIAHDGPIFAAALLPRGENVLLALTGVEDHPLDRSGGSFGHVDPFAFVYAVGDGRARRLSTLNLGAVGVLTPKVVELTLRPDGAAELYVAGAGSALAARASWPSASDPPEELVATAEAGLIGASAMTRAADGRVVLSSPLFDGFAYEGAGAWVRADEETPSVSEQIARASSDEPCGDEETLRLGEALFFTELMGPFQSSEGALSRFTCETCHFEGGIDGRVHSTGRGEVRASTKPLFGLAENGPHFTRALDRDLSRMVYAEFRVAAANTDHDPWFSLDEAGLSWPLRMPFADGPGDPASLRRALVRYLAALPPPPNPFTRGRERFEPEERRGAERFAALCEGCHAARLVADEPASRVTPDRWEALVLAPESPIVWARDGYEVSGIEPRVHPDGARPSSLKRIARKTPYFSNGSASSLEDVVRDGSVAPEQGGAFLHAPPGGARVAPSDADVAAIAAFLRLL